MLEDGKPDWIRRVLSIPIDCDGSMKLDEALVIVRLIEDTSAPLSRIACLRLARHVHPDRHLGSKAAIMASQRVSQAMAVCDSPQYSRQIYI